VGWGKPLSGTHPHTNTQPPYTHHNTPPTHHTTTLPNMGRHTKLTPETHNKIIQALKAGNYLETAAQYANIDQATVHRWLNRGADETEPDPRYREFREAVQNARAEAEARNVALIQKAANEGTWQAAAWFLERTAHSRWGRKASLEVSGEGGGAIIVDVDAQALEAKIRAILGGSESKTPALPMPTITLPPVDDDE